MMLIKPEATSGVYVSLNAFNLTVSSTAQNHKTQTMITKLIHSNPYFGWAGFKLMTEEAHDQMSAFVTSRE
jgi:hypothetical protein